MSDEHLTHGWEPDLDADDSLLRQFVLAQADHTAFVADRVGGRSQRWSDLAAADPDSAVFFDNMAVLLTPPTYTDLDDVTARLGEFYPPERHFGLLSAWPSPDLSKAGLELLGHPPFMLRPPGGEAPPPPPGLEIRPVRTSADLADFVTTIMAAFDMRAGEDLPLTDPRILGGPLELFVGYINGTPVATSGARIGHGIVDIEWVSCLVKARGSGIGAALTWAATMARPELPATLIASDDGQPVYAKMGFLRLLRMTMWHRPPLS